MAAATAADLVATTVDCLVLKKADSLALVMAVSLVVTKVG